jgi:hypothetical protein
MEPRPDLSARAQATRRQKGAAHETHCKVGMPLTSGRSQGVDGLASALAADAALGGNRCLAEAQQEALPLNACRLRLGQ